MMINASNSNDFTCDRFAETLADLLERELDEPTRAAMEAHAIACGDCGPLLADLRKLRVDAANLGDLAPSRDLWSGIAARIETPVVAIGAGDSGLGTRKRRTVWIGVAAAGLVAITATVTHEITKRSLSSTPTVAMNPVVVTPTPRATLTSPDGERRVPSPGRSESRAPSPESRRLVSNTRPSAAATYESEIKQLRIIVNQRRGELDSTTVAVIDTNLKIIDNAIAQCRLALAKDPNSRYLVESLNDALDTKVKLLRTAAALPTRM